MENEVIIPEFGIDWIDTKVRELDLDPEDLKAKYLEKADELTQSGMKQMIPDENEFAKFVCTAINANIQREKGVPKMNMEYAPIGNYPEKMTRGGRASVEMIGIAKDEATQKKKFTRLQAWEDETVKKMSVDFGKAYESTVRYIPEAQFEKAHICGVDAFTTFSEKSIDWATPEAINELISKIPTVMLSDVAKNVSKLVENKGKYFPDSLDLKSIMCMVTDFKTNQREDGSWWARYAVVDSSFNDEKARAFSVWVDHDLALKINAGKDSFVKFIGYISEKQDKDTGDFSYDMTACGILPLNIVNGIDQPDEKILARQAQNAVPESEAGIAIEDL